jgi:hypothetical protein
MVQEIGQVIEKLFENYNRTPKIKTTESQWAF